MVRHGLEVTAAVAAASLHHGGRSACGIATAGPRPSLLWRQLRGGGGGGGV